MDNNLQVNNQGKFLTTPKIIFLSLGVIILVEVIFAVKALTSTPPPPAPKVAVQPVRVVGGAIFLETPKKIFRVEEEVPVSIMINTGGNVISGADVIVRFDPKILEASSGAAVKGQVFDQYPLLSVDSKNGVISISGISDIKGGFQDSGLFASVSFKAKFPGTTVLSIDFQKGATIDSNLVETNTSLDVLESVNSLEVTVQ